MSWQISMYFLSILFIDYLTLLLNEIAASNGNICIFSLVTSHFVMFLAQDQMKRLRFSAKTPHLDWPQNPPILLRNAYQKLFSGIMWPCYLGVEDVFNAFVFRGDASCHNVCNVSATNSHVGSHVLRYRVWKFISKSETRSLVVYGVLRKWIFKKIYESLIFQRPNV